MTTKSFVRINTKEELPKEIEKLILKNQSNRNFVDRNSVLDGQYQLHDVPSPFYLPGNDFRPINIFSHAEEYTNDIIEINVNKVAKVIFTGGCFYNVYEKMSNDSYIVNGNDEEGYNIFHLI